MCVFKFAKSRKALFFLLNISSAACHPQIKHSNLARRQSHNVTYPYQNASLCIDARVDDLIGRMTIEEKAGQLFHTQLAQGENGTLAPTTSSSNGTEKVIGEWFLTHFNLLGTVDDVKQTAEWYNLIQETALNTRLGIPITLSTDPRHAFTEAEGSSISANSFSQWPESLGLAALRDPDLVYKFAEAARQEYLAIGIRTSLHPQIDLSTEYRWARIVGTMGEDAELTSKLVVAYIKGFQGEEFGAHSVSTTTKHFPGGGPMENGEDSHFTYGKNE